VCAAVARASFQRSVEDSLLQIRRQDLPRPLAMAA
jgi:hypothetical protein